MASEVSVSIAAPPARVWEVLVDIRRWPEWTPSVEWVKFDEPELTVGSTAVLKQPKLPVSTWRVTELEPERSFVWVSKAGGVTTTATHLLEPEGSGCRVTLRITHRGLIAPLAELMSRKLTRQYLQQEAEGLRRRSEQTD